MTAPADIPLALTAGDPSGIGADTALMAWLQRRERALPAFYMLSDPAFLASRARALGFDVPIREVAAGEAVAAFGDALPVVPLDALFADTPGIPSSDNAPGIIDAITRGVDDTMAGLAAALVTGPIAKCVLYEAGFGFPGHTEFLAHLATRADGQPVTPVMMLAGPELRAVPVTIHIPLGRCAGRAEREAIVRGLRHPGQGSARRASASPRPGSPSPGLNPHAGEGGALGTEELAIIRPVVAALRRQGIDARGPLPADTMFHAEARAAYDAARRACITTRR